MLFDVDYVIWVPENNWCWYGTQDWQRYKDRYPSWFADTFENAFKNTRKPEIHYKSIWHAQETSMLIEPNIVTIIESLQNRNVPVLALTGITSGSYATIPSLPRWRFEKLKRCNIDFGKTNFKDDIFNNLAHEDGHYPMLYKGMLCSGPDTKGRVLASFLKRVAWQPSRIIFFDDNMLHLQSVVEEMRQRSFPLDAYEYRGAHQLSCPLDKEIVQLQLQHLIEHEQWLSYDSACALFNK